MSTAGANSPGGGQIAEYAGLFGLLVVGLAFAFYLFGDRERPLERSAMGHQGLIAWLQSEGIETRYAAPFPVVDPDIGLRILPVQDTDLTQVFERPETREDYLATGTERDISRGVFETKLQRLPTLVILPKWTRAVRHSGYAHESLLLPTDQAADAVADVFRGDLLRPRQPVTRIRVDGGKTIVLYAAQLFPDTLASRCTPVISGAGGHLLIRCSQTDGPPFHVLSDPDLMNTHGLMLGDNALVAKDIVARLADDAPVIVDTTDAVFVMEQRAPPRKRQWSDLMRFFAYPFSLLWFGLGALFGLALWRAWRRFGPPRIVFDDTILASRGVSLAAKARLLRRTGHDRRLIEVHVTARLAEIADLVLGPRSNRSDPLTALSEHLRGGDPDLAASFTDAALAALSPAAGPGVSQMLARVDAFEREAERVLDGFARI